VSTLTLMLEAVAQRPLDGDFGSGATADAVRALAPSVAASMATDHHALAMAIQTIAHDTLHRPTDEHERLLAALRNDDDSALAASFRLLMAHAIVEASRERAHRGHQMARYTAYWQERAA
jgi:hypothetical protein